ncbi:MAG: hypothetical protein WCE97_03720 [Candidatus Cybelea sp.]
MKPTTEFTISRSGDGAVPEFSLHEQCWFDYGRIASVRACLEEHLKALRIRTDALQSILATDDPEKAERLLFDHVDVVAKEVTLRPRRDFVAFEAFMKAAFRP